MKVAKPEKLHKTRRVAERLDVQPHTIVRWIREGRLRAFKVGRVWRVPESAIQELLRSESSPTEV